MATNLLESLKSTVGMDLAEHSATFFNEEPSNTRSAVNGTFGALLAGMIQRVSYDKGAKDLHKILMKEDVREYDIEDIFTRSPQTVNGMVNRGTHFLPSIYPGRQREATNVIAEDSKIKKLTSSKMMKVCSPLMLNSLAKHVQENKLDVNGLKSYLNGMKGDVKSSVPSKFFDEAELSAFGWTRKAIVKEEPKPKKVKAPKVKKVKEVVVEPVVEQPVEDVGRAATGGMSLLKWLLPLLLIIGLLWFLVGRGCSGVATKPTAAYVPPAKVEAIENVTQSVAAPVKNLFGSVNEAAKSALSSISFAAGSAGDQMIKFIDGGATGDARFRFKNLNFASGSANIDGSTGVEVDNMAAVLKAYDDVKVTIEGFTDSKGNPQSNQTLSQQRADAVKNRLVAAGISGDRLMTKGFGAADPIADNETAEGRAQNRRIEVVVAK